jgi:hypothetical protein
MEIAILFLISLLIVIIYNILSYCEMRLVQNEYKPIKVIVKDSIIIILASLGSLWLYTNYEKYFIDFFSILMNKSGQQLGSIVSNTSDIQIFTDLPDF